jgi:7-keto-8-aminopelargonate synthetase-like enzyme
MAHRVAPQVAADLDDIWYFVAKESGSVEIASRLIDSITNRFLLLARNPTLDAAVMMTLALAYGVSLCASTSLSIASRIENRES